tara:strand:+ start:534 stop:698 length:165 start_codon:yes stop_codon:yes gene_type:complete
MEDINKKALWIPPDLHKAIKIFAIKQNMNIEAATQLLLKLGLCSYSEEKENDRT